MPAIVFFLVHQWGPNTRICNEAKPMPAMLCSSNAMGPMTYFT